MPTFSVVRGFRENLTPGIGRLEKNLSGTSTGSAGGASSATLGAGCWGGLRKSVRKEKMPVLSVTKGGGVGGRLWMPEVCSSSKFGIDAGGRGGGGSLVDFPFLLRDLEREPLLLGGVGLPPRVMGMLCSRKSKVDLAEATVRTERTSRAKRMAMVQLVTLNV